MSIAVVVCAYNEEKNILRVCRDVIDILERLACDYEVIIVDDGSTDGTRGVVDSFMKVHPRVKLVVHAQNQGIGKSLLDGYRLAQMDYITWLPADGQIFASDIGFLYKHMHDYDMVVSYYIKRPPSIFRWMTSKGVRLLLFILFGGMPRYEGTYMFRRELLEKIVLRMDTSFVLNYEFVIKAKQQGCKILAVPTTCLERASGKSKVLGFKKIFFIFRQIILLRLKCF